jgi:glycerophosphoryl diester phosphodiesterase
MVRLFAHRGFWLSKDLQNSISSLNSAYQNNFKAIEFDVWFRREKLLLKHDSPKPKDKTAHFDDYLRFGNEFNYWIDFKNLNQTNAVKVFSLVKNYLEESAIDLDQIYIAPFKTDYKIAKKLLRAARKVFGDQVQFVAVCEKKEQIPALLKFLHDDKVFGLSIFHELIDEKLLKEIPEVEIFAWTVNDEKRIQELETLGVKNFATDKITPQIYESHSRLFRPQSTR